MPRNYLVIDLEATCWEQNDPLRGENEIIEIGMAVLSPQKTELWRGGWFVRPKSSPVLSNFCTKLTTIKQDQIDNAPSFPVVMDLVKAQIFSDTGNPINESLFVSWGNYDRNQFQKDCALHAYDYPFGEHLNLKQE